MLRFDNDPIILGKFKNDPQPNNYFPENTLNSSQRV